MSKPNFVQDCLAGRAKPADIERYFNEWHDSGSTMDVDDYLGLTFKEYGQWVVDSDAIENVIEERRKQAAVPKKRKPSAGITVPARSA